MPDGSTITLDDLTVAEAAAFVAQIEALAADAPSSHRLPVSEQREMMAMGAEPHHEHAAMDEIGGVPVRILEPERVDGTYLHVHGGGWTMGSCRFQDQRLWRVACGASARVISVEYRLAPEHPFPACVDDCLAVAERVAGGRVVIGGESAGAHLAAVVLTRLRAGFRGANLAYGCFDLGMSEGLRRWGERCLIISTPIVEWHIEQLLPGIDASTRRSPEMSPLYADLTGFPPALLTVGTDDPLLSDSIALAARWPAATLEVYPGGFHAFDLFPIRMGQIAEQRQIDFVRRCIADDRDD